MPATNFTSLPREIRDEIFWHALVLREGASVHSCNVPMLLSNCADILSVQASNGVIADEACAVGFGEHPFEIPVEEVHKFLSGCYIGGRHIDTMQYIRNVSISFPYHSTTIGHHLLLDRVQRLCACPRLKKVTFDYGNMGWQKGGSSIGWRPLGSFGEELKILRDDVKPLVSKLGDGCTFKIKWAPNYFLDGPMADLESIIYMLASQLDKEMGKKD